MDEPEICGRQQGDAKDILRRLVWAGGDTRMGMVPARRQSMELLAEALPDSRIAGLLER